MPWGTHRHFHREAEGNSNIVVMMMMMMIMMTTSRVMSITSPHCRGCKKKMPSTTLDD